MNIQFYPAELDYVNAKLKRGPRAGSFLAGFLQCCLDADFQNYELLRSALQVLMEKYPADPDDLAAEREERVGG